jgi:predicted transcriptional regulator
MPDPQHETLSRRERQIMDVIYRRGEATALDVIEDLPDPPTYSAVRALLAVLERKGHVKHTTEGTKYVYSATRSRQRAAKSAIKRLLSTFFDNSVEKAVATLLEGSDSRLSEKDLDRLSQLIDKAKEDKGK